MPAGIPTTTKTLVIQQWLQGRARNDIAAENGISSGAVTNIINEWRHKLGFAGADELRELAVTMKKIGITAAQCALGFRIATVMLRIGVNEDNIESFILDVYNRCKDIGLSPENISSYLMDLLEFSKTVWLSKIPEYIREKMNEKEELEKQIKKLNEQIETLEQERTAAESLRNAARQETKTTISELKWNSNLKVELAKYGISIDNIPKFAQLVNNLKQYDYNVENVMNEFLDLQGVRLRCQCLQESIPSLENSKKDLERQCFALETIKAMHNQVISEYLQLENMGFGLNQLQFLLTTVNEIARENNLPVSDAIKKFLSDVERQYNNKLGFESKVESLRNEVNKLNQEEAMLRTRLLSLPSIGPKLVKLTQSGVTEQDIVNISAMIERYNVGIDKQSFVSELEVYGGLKSGIQKLTKEIERLRTEVDSLQTQKQDLNTHSQCIISSLINSRHTFDFLQGRVDSLRNEILWSVLIATCVAGSTKSHFEHLEKLKANSGDEFASLSKAFKGEESVSIQELKKELIKAIEITRSKLDVNDRLNDTLSSTRLALINKGNDLKDKS